MTVFHVLPQFHYVNDQTIIGGYPSVVARLAAKQAVRGTDVQIVSRMPASTPFSFGDVKLVNLEATAKDSHRHPFRFAKKVFQFLRGRLTTSDSVHFHSGHAEYAAVSAVLSLVLRRRVIHTIYCPLQGGLRGVVQRVVIGVARISGVAFSGMSRNICNTLPVRAAWTPPVVDTSYFTPEHHAPNTCQIVFVGNAVPSKGLIDLLPAFVNLVDGLEGGELIRLVVTTELARSSEHEDLQRVLADLDGTPAMSQIEWLSIVPDMRQLLAQSAIHVAPFRDTNGPSDYFMSTLEAMAMGKVCVVSDLPGMAELVEDGVNGFVFQAGNSFELKHALQRAIECNRAQIGEKARETVVSTCGETAVDAYNNLYGALNA